MPARPNQCRRPGKRSIAKPGQATGVVQNKTSRRKQSFPRLARLCQVGSPSTAYELVSASRISVNSTTSSLGLGGSAGFSSSSFSIRAFAEFIALTTMKMANAIMTKSMTTLMKDP